MIERILLEADTIQTRVVELGEEITQAYPSDSPLLLVGLLKGSLFFLADLSRAIALPVEIELMQVASYGANTRSSGAIQILKGLDRDIDGLDVLIVEDIVDTGLTLDTILPGFKARTPRSLKVCTLLDKPDRRQIEVPVDFTGFQIPDQFVVGYGLDFNQQYRNLPYIAVFSPP